jgi:hypothetical protein
MTMISLKLSKEESGEASIGMSSDSTYGYGTCINLNDEQVAALGLDKMAVGSKVKITAFGVIDSARVEVGDDDGDKDTAPYMSIQLTDMEASSASSVNASAMYPSSNG